MVRAAKLSDARRPEGAYRPPRAARCRAAPHSHARRNVITVNLAIIVADLAIIVADLAIIVADLAIIVANLAIIVANLAIIMAGLAIIMAGLAIIMADLTIMTVRLAIIMAGLATITVRPNSMKFRSCVGRASARRPVAGCHYTTCSGFDRGDSAGDLPLRFV